MEKNRYLLWYCFADWCVMITQQGKLWYFDSVQAALDAEITNKHYMMKAHPHGWFKVTDAELKTVHSTRVMITQLKLF